RATPSSASMVPANCALMRDWFRPPTEAEARCIRVICSRAATNGCNGLFIEAAWVAVGCSSYFGGIYRYHRARGKKANIAITIVARRMCRIAFTLLKERRNFQEQHRTFPGRSAVRDRKSVV